MHINSVSASTAARGAAEASCWNRRDHASAAWLASSFKYATVAFEESTDDSFRQAVQKDKPAGLAKAG